MSVEPPAAAIVPAPYAELFQFLPPVGSSQSIFPPADPTLISALYLEICRIPTDQADLATFACSDLIGFMTDTDAYRGNTIDQTDPTAPQYDAPVDFSAPEITDQDLLLLRVGIVDPGVEAGFRTLGIVPVAFSRSVQQEAAGNGIDASRESRNRTLPLKFIAGLGVATEAFCPEAIETDPLFDQGETCTASVLTPTNRVFYFPDADNPVAAVLLPEVLFQRLGVDAIVVFGDDLPNADGTCLSIPNEEAELCIDLSSSPAFGDEVLDPNGNYGDGILDEDPEDLIKVQMCLDQGVDPEAYSTWRQTSGGAQLLFFDPQGQVLFPASACAGFPSTTTASAGSAAARFARAVFEPLWDLVRVQPLYAGHVTTTSLATGFSNFGWATSIEIGYYPPQQQSMIAAATSFSGTFPLFVFLQDHEGAPLLDDGGNLVPDPGVPVLWTVTDGGGTVQPDSRAAGTCAVPEDAPAGSICVLTDADGVSWARWNVTDASVFNRLVGEILGDYDSGAPSRDFSFQLD